MTNQIRLSWEDPTTGESRHPILSVPIALGREFSQMPGKISGQRVSRIVLDSLEVSRYHVLITWEGGNYVASDQNSSNGLYVNDRLCQSSIVMDGDVLRVGPYSLQLALITSETPLPLQRRSEIRFHPQTQRLEPQPSPIHRPEPFPPPIFSQKQVDPQALHATGLQVDEVDYLSVGGGLGSFVWIDCLRIAGVPLEQITALGVDASPYGRYQQLCLNSQIPLHERLRSNSDSCPDNIWGFPSYAWREAWRDLTQGKTQRALRHLWQVFGEPDVVQTYTPKAENVFNSIDREARRIGWQHIFKYGSVRAIRKTTDGRYAIALSGTTTGQRHHAFYLARYVHLATGYPAIKFLPDLQAYREKTNDFKTVVNAYEPHDHIYQFLEQQGGTVVIRGRGIVASRIIQRVYEARQRNPKIRLINLMRSPKPKGNKYGYSERAVEHHLEFQPFNWPKACWGGELRYQLEAADSQNRQRLLADWGGTTTADRRDWREIVDHGMTQGWYVIQFGEVERVEPENQGVVTHIKNKNYQGTMRLEANFIIDATGLDADVTASPLLNDLITHYNLPLNQMSRLAVSNNFEVEAMRTPRGQMYAAGAITLGGPYAAVDSFLGLQYVALRIIQAMADNRSPQLQKLNASRSFSQWLKWVRNQNP